jgi:hypothetical protein
MQLEDTVMHIGVLSMSPRYAGILDGILLQ